ncbi:MAG TPA: farnesyl diphosphate synthase [Pyrinomonadaceae bacterium]|jgi:geranylgeranyl pyrophosphate synthase|nr:farnesyl diphosphate synthase [Pyrinomonadaceae bacterium]
MVDSLDTTPARAHAETEDALTDVQSALAEAQEFLARCRALVETRLDEIVPRADLAPVAVHEAMRWSLFAGGKRLRPSLLLAAGFAFGASEADLLDTACAFELLHTYSLVHDDLPAMDDDDLRRGRPTCHVRFGEAHAILAGDALQTLAFQTIAADERLSAQVRVRLVAELGRAAGTPAGMVAGQAHDLEAEARADVTGEELEHIHRRKTGALIAAAARAGAIIAGASDEELAAVTRYAHETGLLFQITDDLLDVTATAADLGKTPGKDARSAKATYVSLYGLDAARARALAVHQEARAALAQIQRPTRLLHALARFILERGA